ncbi:PilX N-terminal domain-containing pilus assembly protein [Lysobacter enzymogenes]|uniref:pilus assembly PilX family protein n=1 Tax=Lysobacter enzymogenes TaxID=69 RepID=UPI00385058FF
MPPRRRTVPASARRQRGVALYVALIMLILLALLGVVGMQVTAMQERMSLNYLRVNQTFQNAEMRVRQAESAIGNEIYGAKGKGSYLASDESCRTDFDSMTWGNNPSLEPPQVYTRQIDKCVALSSIKAGQNKYGDTSSVYHVSVADRDTLAATASTRVVIDTIYIP